MANPTTGSNPDEIEIDHEHPETHTNQDNDNLTTIQVTPTSHMPDEPTTIQETPLSQMPEASPHQLTTTEQPNTSTLPAENETESQLMHHGNKQRKPPKLPSNQPHIQP